MLTNIIKCSLAAAEAEPHPGREDMERAMFAVVIPVAVMEVWVEVIACQALLYFCKIDMTG